MFRLCRTNNVDISSCHKLELSVAVAGHELALNLALLRKNPQTCNRTRLGDFSFSPELLGHDLDSLTVGPKR